MALTRKTQPAGIALRRCFHGIFFRNKENLSGRSTSADVPTEPGSGDEALPQATLAGNTGAAGIIVNADDWGQDRLTTDRILECHQHGAISSVSAMVFMEDSERAAALAREHGLEAGLHLNLVTPFSAVGVPSRLVDQQQRLAPYLMRHRFAQVVFHPGLRRSFEYVVEAQVDEYRRLYGADPDKIDGHHHMHLCTNVLLQELLKPGTIVRRSFSFGPEEKSLSNRMYRAWVDRSLARRHRLADYFFSITPLEPSRLQRIYALARHAVVEMETHPVNPDEYQYLASGEILRQMGNVEMVRPSVVLPRVRGMEKV